MALGATLGFATVAAGVGLTATSAFLVARASLVTSFVEIQTVFVGVRFFAIARGALRYLERYVAHDVTFQLLARLRVWFYAAVEPLAPAVLWRRQSGDVLARIVDDLGDLEQFYVRVLMPAAAALLTALSAGLFLAAFDARLGMALVTGMALLGGIVPIAARRAATPAATAEVRVRGQLSAGVVDGLQGLGDLLASGQDERHLDRLALIQGRLAVAQRRLSLVRGFAALAGALLT
ncbi:MAG: thiol reductant ABC exporter subunit CydC, partial [Actinomycetota bacterium]|nr:thiol reductant ABC exporter subunit CydC [Actinomycetota bacterium]